jgi:hypothetical protein
MCFCYMFNESPLELVSLKAKCQVCEIYGQLRHFSKNYTRVKHYLGSVDWKLGFEYHRQNPQRVTIIIQNKAVNIDPDCIDLKGFNSGSVSDNRLCLDSSAGQSDSLVSCRSRVRIPPEAPFLGICPNFTTTNNFHRTSFRVVTKDARIHSVLTPRSDELEVQKPS